MTSTAEPSDGIDWPAPPTAPVGPPTWILYVDLDAYYVSVELRDRPDLVGRPVIVGPPPALGRTRGVVLSASYEARKFGVRSAMPAGAAARLCPGAEWIAPDFPKYGRVSHEVRALLRRFASVVIPYSIDEAALVVELEDPDAAGRLATTVQGALRDELHLPASIGVARSRAIAKIATDQAKPAGVVVVTDEGAAAFLAPLPVRAIPGVGPKTEELLGTVGVVTIGDLASRAPSDLAPAVGGLGRYLIALARGHPIESTGDDSGPRSRSTDRTFNGDVSDWSEIEAAIREMAVDLASSLAREGLRYGTVGVALRWTDFTRSQRSRTLSAAHEDAASLAEGAVRLGREVWEAERAGAGRAVRTVSVRTERFHERTQRQRMLDEFPPPLNATSAE